MKQLRHFLLLFVFLHITLLFGQSNLQGLKGGDETSGFGGLSVTIGGSFILTGTFSALPGERLDKFITRVYLQGRAERLASITNPKNKEEILKDIEKYARRDITLKHSDGTSQKIDLEKFRLTGDFTHNPYLKHDDFILFPPYDEKMNFISVVGAVNKEIVFQFVEGDRLQDAIAFAGGLDPAYHTIDKVLISRLEPDGKKAALMEFSPSDNPWLQRGDRIVVSAPRSGKKDFKVRVDGEVNRPGYIPVTDGTTTLKEVLALTGGFTPKADLSRAELLRGANVFQSTFFTEELEALLMNRMADITPEDSTTFAGDNKLRFARGNGTINFADAANPNSAAGNFIVQDQDYIIIPQKIDLVYVFGHVNNPGYIQYVPEKGYSYYVQSAGGIGQTPKKELYLIKGKSRSWSLIDPEKPPIVEPGDYIWVPKEPARTFEYYLNRITAVSGVVSAAATILLLIVQLTK